MAPKYVGKRVSGTQAKFARLSIPGKGPSKEFEPCACFDFR